ncbi:hypothetical protein [Streptomyces sp. NPDC059970]|uniref:hypothetical protein n=1 Tax=Streptomyces sp. NPDC059970 TaxID=3347019 RepID=UPI0036957771
MPGSARIDNIVFGSVLHEIYSYVPGPPGDKRLAYERALAHAIDALAPWGQLVIRDFVTLATSREHVDVVVLTSEDGALFAEYLSLTTFLENTLIVGLNDVYRLFRGRANAVAEALLTLSWGAELLPQESKERYCLASLRDPADAPERATLFAGMRTVHAKSGVQPDYLQQLAD